MKLKTLVPWKKSCDQHNILESRDITLPTKVHLVKAMVFPVIMLRMWELDRKEGWAPKNWCFWMVVLEKTLESPLDSKEIQPVHPKGNQSWIFIGRTDAEAEAPILWPPDGKSQLIGRHLDARKDWRQEKKGTTEDEMVGWHHWLDGHEFEQDPGVGEGQGSLEWGSLWGHKETRLSDWTMNNSNLIYDLNAYYITYITILYNQFFYFSSDTDTARSLEPLSIFTSLLFASWYLKQLF